MVRTTLFASGRRGRLERVASSSIITRKDRDEIEQVSFASPLPYGTYTLNPDGTPLTLADTAEGKKIREELESTARTMGFENLVVQVNKSATGPAVWANIFRNPRGVEDAELARIAAL